MSMTYTSSEIGRLRRQIAEEQQAAYLGLHGLAQGTARHTFIEHRMETIGHCFAQLSDLVGAVHAIELVAQTLQEVPIGSSREEVPS